MWKVLKKRDVLNYWTLAEYVSLVVDVVPDMLTDKHRLQLLLGLRARVASQLYVASWFFFVIKTFYVFLFCFISPHQYILELCRNELMDRDLILSHLKKIKSCPLVDVSISHLDLISHKMIHIVLICKHTWFLD